MDLLVFLIKTLLFALKMSLNFLKKTSIVTVPALYLLYLNKRNAVLAKEATTTSADLSKLIDEHSLVQRLPNVPITNLRRSKQECIGLVEAFRVLQNAPGVVCAVSYRGKEIWSFGNGLYSLQTLGIA